MILVPLIVALVLSIVSIGTAGVASSKTKKFNTIVFPDDKSYGSLGLLKKSPTGFSYQNKVFKRVEARGRINVARDIVFYYTPSFHVGMHLEEISKVDKSLIVALNLEKLPLTGEELSELSEFKNLEDLKMKCSDLKNYGLIYITRLKKLYRLNVSQTQITAAGLKHLKAAPNIRDLIISNNSLGDSSAPYLIQLKQIERLNLAKTFISDKTAQALISMPNLKYLTLAKNRGITDSALRDYHKFPDLKELNLEGTLVTSAMVLYLAKCKTLESIRLSSGKKNRIIAYKIRQVLPDCKVEFDRKKDIPLDIFSPLH